ncbi:MAG: lipopolysaccharide transport periplasmic protein LptA [Xanthomonadales bacterium]|jgi:lipopolysaccharide export system protein LptA|nr:lipopolysaccharide transport periplasmic protein LptA [Xanthomonadales bacterium]
MKFSDKSVLAGLCLLLCLSPAMAMKTDRQEPLDVKADSTDGTLGDGVATLQGSVEIRQGTLLVQADVAQVFKSEGRVRRIELTGNPVQLEQQIEEQGLVTANAARIDYEVASGIVTLTGGANVVHPQYRISGEKLVYDMNVQHFQGAGGEDEGRIRIHLEPEMLQGDPVKKDDDAGGAAPPGANSR